MLIWTNVEGATDGREEGWPEGFPDIDIECLLIIQYKELKR